MWLYAFAGDVPMFRQLASGCGGLEVLEQLHVALLTFFCVADQATVDAFARYDALLQSEMTVVSAQGDVDTGDDWDD